jgi:hypothetical protein
MFAQVMQAAVRFTNRDELGRIVREHLIPRTAAGDRLQGRPGHRGAQPSTACRPAYARSRQPNADLSSLIRAAYSTAS